MGADSKGFEGDATAVLERVTDAFFALDTEWRFTYVNEQAAELLERDEESLFGTEVWEAFPNAVDSQFQAEYQQAMETQEPTTFEARFDPLDAYFEVRAFPSETGLSVYFKDISESRRRQEQLENHRDKLAALVDRTEAIQTVNQRIASAGTREAVESTVCQTLADTGFYQVAWIGGHDDGALTLRAGAGASEADLETLVEAASAEGEAGTVQTALHRETIALTQNIDGNKPGPRAEQLEERGYHSTISLPLVHDDTSFGVLTITATEAHAFSGMERELLGSLSDTIAYALQAVEDRERYRSVVTDVLDSAIDAGIVVVDADDEVAWTNQRAGTFFGHEQAAIVGQSRAAFVEQQLLPAVEDPTNVAVHRPKDCSSVSGADELHVTAGSDREERHLERRRTPIASGLYAGGCVELFYDITDRKRSERALAESERHRRTLLGNLPGMVYQCRDDPGWPMEFVSEGCRDLTGYEPSALESGAVSWGEDVIHEDDCADVRSSISDSETASEPFELTYRIVQADGETRWVSEKGQHVETIEGEHRLEGFITDITERRERERALERLNHLNAVIRRLNQTLVRSPDRETIQETVCSELTSTDQYEAAWYADVDLANDELAMVASSGIAADSVGSVSASDEETIASRAVRTETVTVDRVHTAAQRSLVEKTACSVDTALIAAIPIEYAKTKHGVLCICTDDESAFPEDVRAVFGELGETIGHALNAHLRKEGLVSDTATKLEFRLRDFPPGNDELMADMPDGSEFTIEETIPTGEGTVLQYVTTRGIPKEGFEDIIDAVSTVTRVRELSSSEEAVRYELEQSDPPMVKTLAAKGGRVESVSIEDGDLHVVAELPDGADVRRVVEEIFEEYPSADLEAQRSVTRAETTSMQFRDDVQAGLTERQRTALEVAYFAGYFEWPRETTGEGVAESLDVSQSTFSQHLRAGEQKTFELLFDGERPHDTDQT